MAEFCKNKFGLTDMRVKIDTGKKKMVRHHQQQYGDGYLARRLDGINTLLEEYDVTTEPQDVEAVKAMEAEIIALESDSFSWQAPDDSEAKDWVLDPYEWTWDYETSQIASLRFRIVRYYK